MYLHEKGIIPYSGGESYCLKQRQRREKSGSINLHPQILMQNRKEKKCYSKWTPNANQIRDPNKKYCHVFMTLCASFLMRILFIHTHISII